MGGRVSEPAQPVTQPPPAVEGRARAVMDEGSRSTARGRLYAGTSGFSYPAWVPRFYAPGKASRKLLAAYATRLPAVELHNTFYRRPNQETVAKWLRETPEHFRFCPKAQRSATWRAWSDAAAESMAWLTASLGVFGDRLGCVLLGAPLTLERDDGALSRLLAARPAGLPMALELPHPTWAADEVHERLRAHGVTLVATDRDEGEEPDLRLIGPFIYLRLRRTSYAAVDLDRWARRIEPFLSDGLDVYVFFRHDGDGESALRAEEFLHRSRDAMTS
jgi:uncharacterized protein YecE (DUF72 family)